MANCPKCNTVLDVEDDELDEGDELTCLECGANVAVTSTDPVEIEVIDEAEAADEDEDEDDDDLDVDEDEEEEDEEKY